MDVTEYIEHDATGLAELVQAGKVSADEVHGAARQAIGSVNGELNALVGDLFETPLAAQRRTAPSPASRSRSRTSSCTPRASPSATAAGCSAPASRSPTTPR